MFKDEYDISHVYGTNLLQEYNIEEINLIDIRETFELKICNVPGSLHIPMYNLLGQRDKYLDKSKQYFILCHTGQRSYYTCDELIKDGYDVVNVVGGIAAIDEYNVPY